MEAVRHGAQIRKKLLPLASVKVAMLPNGLKQCEVAGEQILHFIESGVHTAETINSGRFIQLVWPNWHT